jgi:hypothetical protein
MYYGWTVDELAELSVDEQVDALAILVNLPETAQNKEARQQTVVRLRRLLATPEGVGVYERMRDETG